MSNLEEYFFKSDDGQALEGYLSDDKCAELLIILKEPHSDDNPYFWFYNVVNNLNDIRSKPGGRRFFNILGSLVCGILGETKNDEATKENALKRCAFINLYPYDGKAVAEHNKSGYSLTYSVMNNLTVTDNKIEEWEKVKGINISSVADRRTELFKHLSESNIKYILTVPEIFAMLSKAENKDKKTFIAINYKNSGKEKTRKFNQDQYRLSDKITVFEFWHPSYTRINYENLDKALIAYRRGK